MKAMSPENSGEESAHDDAEDSDEELGRPVPAARNSIIVTSPLGWRSQRFTELLESLDRKWMRRCSELSTTMIKKRINGPKTSDIEASEGILGWMKKSRCDDNDVNFRS